MPRYRRLNNHNTAKKNGYFLGHSDNLITLSLSLSLSLRRSPIRETITHLILRTGRPRLIYGFSCIHTREVGLFFLSPSDDGGDDSEKE